MARSTRQVAVLAATVATVLAACSPGLSPTASPAHGPLASVTTPASAPPTVSATPLPTVPTPAGGQTAVPTPSGDCLHGPLRVLYPGADNPLRSTCLHTGTTLVITLITRGAYRWAPVTSSTPAVVAVQDRHTDPSHTVITTLRALRPGTATLTSANTFTPDTHGPPSRAWQLQVRVIP